MSGTSRKNTLMDIFVKSLQKDNAFLKDKLSEQQKEFQEIENKYKEDQKKQQLEMSALKDDLSTMVRDVTRLRTENVTLMEKLEEYESCYVPASGSKKMKDALAESRKQLREVVEKYNTLVDTYEVSRQQFASAVTEANSLRVDNDHLHSELSKSKQLYQSSTKELEENRIDMANMMKEMSELKQAIADGSFNIYEESTSARSNDEVSSTLRNQIHELTTLLEQANQLPTPSSPNRSVIDSQAKLDQLSNKVNFLMRTYSRDDSLLSLTSSIAEFRVALTAIGKGIDSLSQENHQLRQGPQPTSSNHRLEEAEKKIKELSISIINITNERDKLLLQQESSTPAPTNDRIRELEKEADSADRKVIELTQRCVSFERSVKALSSRADIAEKKVKELTETLQLTLKERDQLKNSLKESERKLQTEKQAVARSSESDHRRELQRKDDELGTLRSTIMSLEKEIQQYQQEIEELKLPPPIPELPSELPPLEHFFLPESVTEEISYEEMDAEDAVASVLQQMIDSPEDFNLDAIDDVSFPDCDFSDHHMMLFTKFLRENHFPCLQVIDVSHNLLTEASVIPFIQTLLEKEINSLQVLNLSYNQLDDHFAQALLDLFVQANVDCSIKSILFDGNPFSPEVLQQMKCIYGGGQ